MANAINEKKPLDPGLFLCFNKFDGPLKKRAPDRKSSPVLNPIFL
jgi:hypothetical protein